MRNFLEFYRECIKHAWRDSLKLAYAAHGLWGTLLLWAGLWLGRAKLPLPDDPILAGFIITLLSIAASWVAVFLVRFSSAPPMLSCSHTAAVPLLWRAACGACHSTSESGCLPGAYSPSLWAGNFDARYCKYRGNLRTALISRRWVAGKAGRRIRGGRH